MGGSFTLSRGSPHAAIQMGAVAIGLERIDDSMVRGEPSIDVTSKVVQPRIAHRSGDETHLDTRAAARSVYQKP